MNMDKGLHIQGLCIGASGRRLLHDLELRLGESHCLALIGESGSGKTLTGLAVGGLLPRDVWIEQGTIRWNGVQLESASSSALRSLRGHSIAYIFQNYATAFSPHIPLDKQLHETLASHTGMGRQERTSAIAAALDDVGLSYEQVKGKYSFQFSGGQMQRVCIAAAMMLKPGLIIADEPTSALDPQTEEQILELLHRLKQRDGCSVLLITHDLGIARHYADDIAVMHLGRVKESGTARDVLEHATHPYTQKLIAAERLLSRDAADDEKRSVRRQSKGPQYNESTLLAVRHARKTFDIGIQALNDVALNIREGECVGLIGASGSGKSTLARCILQLEPLDEGEIFFRNERLSGKGRIHAMKGVVQAVFQQPTLSLNSRLRIIDSLMEPLDAVQRNMAQARIYRNNRWKLAEQWLERVGLSPDLLVRFPHQLSGGQKQRICIARAISTEPAFLILDEPTASLDMIMQAQILQLLKELQYSLGYGSLFISHDHSAVRFMADRIMSMEKGSVTETADF
jgi:ABC-type glutathione transport system ATPase component